MTRKTLAEMLIRDLAEGLRVFNVRDKLNIPEDLIAERSRGLATIVLANYEVTAAGPLCRVCGDLLQGEDAGRGLCSDKTCEEIDEQPSVSGLAARLATGGAS